MATKVLNGAAWDTAGNWDGGVLPDSVAPDAVVMGATGGNVHTFTTANGDDFASITLPPHFQYDLGSTTTPILTAAALLKVMGSGNCYIEADLGGTTMDINETRLSGTHPGVTLEIGSNAADIGLVDLITVTRGRLIVKGNISWDASAGKVILRPLNGDDANVFCKLSSGNGSIQVLPAFIMYGGRCESEDALTDAEVRGGRLIQTQDTITTLEVWPGGYVEYNYGGTITTCTLHTGATLDMLKTGDTKTITNLTMHKGASFIADTEGGQTVLTNPPVLLGEDF